jgi:hypothetical protein
MTTFPNPPTTNGRNDGGPGTLVASRLSDIAPSVPDPGTDLKLPSLLLRDWSTIGDGWALWAVIAGQSYFEVEYADLRNDAPERISARQRTPTRSAWQTLKDVFKNASEDTLVEHAARYGARLEERKDASALKKMLKTSGEVFRGLSARFLSAGACLNAGIDLRAPWFPIRNQMNTSGCVGFAVADLVRRQREMRLDVPSARFIWQAAKEVDGEQKPTTMISGAGTSIRAALRVVRHHGFALESEISSETNELYQGSIEEFYRTIGGRRILNFINLGSDAKLRIAWLSLGFPIVCSMMAGQNFVKARGPDAVIVGDGASSPDSFSHAVVIEGFRIGCKAADGTWQQEARPIAELARLAEELHGDEQTDAAGKSARPYDEFPVQYLIRNSAGTDWGDDGYAWMEHNDFLNQAGQCYGIFSNREDLENVKNGNPRSGWLRRLPVPGARAAAAARTRA